MSSSVNYLAISPEIAVTAGLMLVLLVDLIFRGRAKTASGVLSLLTLAVAFRLLSDASAEIPTATLSGMFVLDGFAVVFKALAIFAGAITVVLSMAPMRKHRYEGEYYFLLLASILGTMLMPSSRDLLMLFVSLELVSAPAFVIAGIRKKNARSNEAALKFFIFGVIAAAAFAYGISLIYGFTGSTGLESIGAVATNPTPLLLIGVLMIIVAFGFKVSAVPFHFWAPDTYEGSPTPLAAFLSVSSKAAGFVGLALVLGIGFPALAPWWGPVVGGLALVTMTVGNVLALKQKQLVRLLAYSSIGHAGYMLIPLALIQATGGVNSGVNATIFRSLALYLLIYAVMNLGAFGVAIGISQFRPGLLLRDFSGLGKRAPFAAVALAVFLFSLAGLPPFAGAWAKFYIFVAAINVGTPMAILLASAMVINSVISLFYYVGIIRSMFLGNVESETGSEETIRFRMAPAIGIVVGLCLFGVLALGVFPEPFASFAGAATIAVR